MVRRKWRRREQSDGGEEAEIYCERKTQRQEEKKKETVGIRKAAEKGQ